LSAVTLPQAVNVPNTSSGNLLPFAQNKTIESSSYSIKLHIDSLGYFDTAKFQLKRDTSDAWLDSGQVFQLNYDDSGYLTSLFYYREGVRNAYTRGFSFINRDVAYYYPESLKVCPFTGTDPDYLKGISELFLKSTNSGPAVLADSLVPVINAKAIALEGDTPRVIAPAQVPATRYSFNRFQLLSNYQTSMKGAMDYLVEGDMMGGPAIYYSPDYEIDGEGYSITPKRKVAGILNVMFRHAIYPGSVSNKITIPVILSPFSSGVSATGKDNLVVKVRKNYSNIGILSPDDGRPVTITVNGNPGWTSYEPGTVLVTGTPAMEDRGFYQYSITVDDGWVSVATDFRVKVTDNNAPEISGDGQLPLAVEGEPFFHEVTITDPDNDVLEFDSSKTEAPSWLTVKINSSASVPGKLVVQLSSNGKPVTASNLNIADYRNNFLNFTVRDVRDMPELEEDVVYYGYLIEKPRVKIFNRRTSGIAAEGQVMLTIKMKQSTTVLRLKKNAARLRICDFRGRTVLVDRLYAATCMDLNSLPAGFYLAVIQYTDGSVTCHKLFSK